jgi:electron transfer flavoprotein alpha/beta subunit
MQHVILVTAIPSHRGDQCTAMRSSPQQVSVTESHCPCVAAVNACVVHIIHYATAD